MSEIKPALSAEEWAEAFRSNASDPALVDSAFEFTDPTARHYLAALALYGHPFGFTWNDVGELRDMASGWERENPERLRSLADRIEALLPPRETP